MKELAIIDDKVSSSAATISNARKYSLLPLFHPQINSQLSFYSPFNTEGALQRAKFAVESQYAVVGVLEDLNTTLSVLENYVPKFFRGATKVFYEEITPLNKINGNSFKPPVSEEIKNLVRRNFTREIEFYEFCRQRLHKQQLALNMIAAK